MMTRDILMVFGGFLMGLLAGMVRKKKRNHSIKSSVTDFTVLPRSDRHGEKVIECGAEWTIM